MANMGWSPLKLITKGVSWATKRRRKKKKLAS